MAIKNNSGAGDFLRRILPAAKPGPSVVVSVFGFPKARGFEQFLGDFRLFGEPTQERLMAVCAPACPEVRARGLRFEIG